MRVTDQGDFDEFTSFMDEVRNRQLINMPDSSGSTALMVASYKDHRDIVNFLLRKVQILIKRITMVLQL